MCVWELVIHSQAHSQTIYTQRNSLHSTFDSHLNFVCIFGLFADRLSTPGIESFWSSYFCCFITFVFSLLFFSASDEVAVESFNQNCQLCRFYLRSACQQFTFQKTHTQTYIHIYFMPVSRNDLYVQRLFLIFNHHLKVF